jgi:hypothetical protein
MPINFPGKLNYSKTKLPLIENSHKSIQISPTSQTEALCGPTIANKSQRTRSRNTGWHYGPSLYCASHEAHVPCANHLTSSGFPMYLNKPSHAPKSASLPLVSVALAIITLDKKRSKLAQETPKRSRKRDKSAETPHRTDKQRAARKPPQPVKIDTEFGAA